MGLMTASIIPPPNEVNNKGIIIPKYLLSKHKGKTPSKTNPKDEEICAKTAENRYPATLINSGLVISAKSCTMNITVMRNEMSLYDIS